jgi:hypothetical protein
MTEPHGPEDGFDFDELADYLEELQAGVDAQVTQPRLLGLRAQALRTIDGSGTEIEHGAVALPVWRSHPWAVTAQQPDSWPGTPSPLPVPPIPVPPLPAPPTPPVPLPAPLPTPPLPIEPIPAPRSSPSTWREPEGGDHDPGSRGVSKRQR